MHYWAAQPSTHLACAEREPIPAPPPPAAVHLCFICVLHLANEHGLVINSVPDLDQLLISNVPSGAAQH